MTTMRDVSYLHVLLYGQKIGLLTHVPGDRTIFTFERDYIDNPQRPILSLGFKDTMGGLITDFPPTQKRVLPFFSNLLPEGHLRRYLAEKADVNEEREYPLLWALGQDLPGAVTLLSDDGNNWPLQEKLSVDTARQIRREAFHFSLAGVQLKFSALKDEGNQAGLTIPAHGMGGEWIVKLPSARFSGVPENEFSMMNLARQMGMDVPETQLVNMADMQGLPEGLGEFSGPALAIRRFDRTPEGPVHIEDFAQVFRVYPELKYKRGTYKNIAEILAIETSDADVAEFIRRAVFNTLIGNGDMHLKNWSLIYRQPHIASLAPAYDFLSTVHYMPDDQSALKYVRTRSMDALTWDELAYLASKARVSEKLVLDTARQTVESFKDHWATERGGMPMYKSARDAIDRHLATVPIAGG